jgi:hypothetical protein
VQYCHIPCLHTCDSLIIIINLHTLISHMLTREPPVYQCQPPSPTSSQLPSSHVPSHTLLLFFSPLSSSSSRSSSILYIFLFTPQIFISFSSQACCVLSSFISSCKSLYSLLRRRRSANASSFGIVEDHVDVTAVSEPGGYASDAKMSGDATSGSVSESSIKSSPDGEDVCVSCKRLDGSCDNESGGPRRKARDTGRDEGGACWEVCSRYCGRIRSGSVSR